MADPVLIVIVATCARSLARLADVLAHWSMQRARAELARIAATASPGTEVMEQDRRGGSVCIRVPAPTRADS